MERSCGTALGFLFTTSLHPSPFQEVLPSFCQQRGQELGLYWFYHKTFSLNRAHCPSAKPFRWAVDNTFNRIFPKSGNLGSMEEQDFVVYF